MKKVLLVVMVMGLVLFTGCIGEQTLTCTKDISSSGITMIQTVNVKFVNNKVDTMNTTVAVTLPDSYKSYIDTFVSRFNSQYKSQYGSYEHVKLNTVKKSDNQIDVNIDFDYKNMTDSEKKGLDLVGSERYSNNKKTLEKQGFTCK